MEIVFTEQEKEAIGLLNYLSTKASMDEGEYFSNGFIPCILFNKLRDESEDIKIVLTRLKMLGWKNPFHKSDKKDGCGNLTYGIVVTVPEESDIAKLKLYALIDIIKQSTPRSMCKDSNAYAFNFEGQDGVEPSSFG